MRPITLVVVALLAACGGGDDMPVPKPCAMWPVTITAGVNDAIDFSSASSTYAATIAPATYYSPADLAAAVAAALNAQLAVPEIVAGMNDKVEYQEWSGGAWATRTAYLTPGVYSVAGLAGELSTQMMSVSTLGGFTAAVVGGKIRITGPDAVHGWKTHTTTTPGMAWPTLGFPANSAAAQTITADTVPTESWGAAVDEAGRVTVTMAQAFVFLFSTGSNAATSARDLLGFGTVDTASGTSVTGTHQMQNCWFPEEPVADDTGDLDVFERAQAVALGGAVKSLDFTPTPRAIRTIKFAMLAAQKVYLADEGSAYAGEAFQRLLRSGWARFRWFDDATDLATGTDYVLDLKTAKQLERTRLSPGMPLYGLTLSLRKYV